MANFNKLEVWEKAHALSLFSHQVALGIRGPMYASLKNQIVRAALSIPTNIVEGREQKTDAEFALYEIRSRIHVGAGIPRHCRT